MRNFKVLIVSSNEDFLKKHQEGIQQDYMCHFANTLDKANFLVKEWEPNFIFFDGSTLDSEQLYRIAKKEDSMGVFVFLKNISPQLEKSFFSRGADYILNINVTFESIKYRLKALSKRLPNVTIIKESKIDVIYNMGPLTIFPEDFIVKYNNEIISVTPIQFRLLVAFYEHNDRLLTREWLKEEIWDNAPISPRSIDAQVSKLKKSFPFLSDQLVGIYGKGYVFTKTDKKAA